jgi:CRP/FNR family cyclic AMP-dependent transcriptional regulator
MSNIAHDGLLRARDIAVSMASTFAPPVLPAPPQPPLVRPARMAPLLDIDPELGQFLDPEALAAARGHLGVRLVRLPRGPWNAESLSGAAPGHIGLLIVEGVVSHEVLAEDVTSMELLGTGDILRPWQILGGVDLLRAECRWCVLADTRLAVLDRALAAKLARFPEIYSVMVERLAERCQRLTITQAIGHINRVDRRILTLFWHLAERWGRVTTGGVYVPLALSHRAISQLIGARRPTVSTALAELGRQGQLLRNDDGTWLLTGEPVGRPDPRRRRLVTPRRRLLPRDAAEPESPAEVGA